LIGSKLKLENWYCKI